MKKNRQVPDKNNLITVSMRMDADVADAIRAHLKPGLTMSKIVEAAFRLLIELDPESIGIKEKWNKKKE